MQTKILLVDDREDNLLSMEVILTPDNYHLVKCRSGKEALKILLTDIEFALILMDVKMPILNGFETANLIHEREVLRNIPIIFITANNYGDENMYKGYRSGGIDYILKPINPEILRAKVSVFVKLYEKNRLLLEQEQKLKAINNILGAEISDRKNYTEQIEKINSELRRKIERMESLNTGLKKLAQVAAYNLQHSLVSIGRIASELLVLYKNGNVDEKAMASQLKSELDQLQNNYLDFLALPEISIDRPEFVDTNLNDLLNDLLASMEDTLREKNATVETGLLPTANVIPSLMRYVFQNLINNSLTFNQKNPVIHFRSEAENTPNGKNNGEEEIKYWKIFVEDNGMGIDQQNTEEIFSLFKKLPSGRDTPGAGIGLALCRKIMELHNGSISAHSRFNNGSTFVLSLPVKIATLFKLKAT
jgi:signal transduction histidine kinase